MDNSNKIIVLHKFQPYLRLIQALNLVNFHQFTAKCVYHAFYTSVILLLSPIFATLAIWHLSESNVGLEKIVAPLPILFGLLQMEVTFIALLTMNNTINETINHLEIIVDQRELFTQSWCLRLRYAKLSIIFYLHSVY